MSLVSLTPITLGQDGVLPRTVKMLSTASLATITTAGYLNNRNMLNEVVVPTDKIECIYNYDEEAGTGDFIILTVSISNGIVTLSEALGQAADKDVTDDTQPKVTSYYGDVPTASGNFAQLTADGSVRDGGGIIRCTQHTWDGTTPVTVSALGATATCLPMASLDTNGTKVAITNIQRQTDQFVVTLAGATGGATNVLSIFWCSNSF